MLRTFFAVEIGADARRAAAALVARLRDEFGVGGPGWGGDGVRWVRPENYHVTLRFLGDTPAARIDALVETVRGETRGIAPFALRLGAPAVFPGAHRPRVVALEVEPHEPLEQLAAAVERGVVAAGFEPEARTFNGHLTLGRVRSTGRRPRRSAGLASLAGLGCDAAPFAVDSFVLFRSELAGDPAGGSRYTPLERLALGGSASP